MLMTRFARTAAVVLMLAGVLWASPVAAEDEPDCDPKQRACMSETARTARATRNVDPPPRLMSTFREGQTTTFTAPVPSDKQPVTRCANAARSAGKAPVAPTPQFRSDGTLVCDYTIGVPDPDAPGRYVVRSSISTFGPCRGPYTVEPTTADSRVQVASGNRRVRVATSTSDNLDDTGTLVIGYLLHGTSTRTFKARHDAEAQTSEVECTLTETVRVQINAARRAGMTEAVARHAPAQSYLNTPSTVTWTCTQAVIDRYVNELNSPAPCTLGTVISTTRSPRFPTPRRCTIIVTVAKNGKGFGSTNCLTSNEVAAYEDEIRSKHPDEGGIDVSSLPKCPDSTAPADMNALPTDSSDRQRCVAKN